MPATKEATKPEAQQAPKPIAQEPAKAEERSQPAGEKQSDESVLTSSEVKALIKEAVDAANAGHKAQMQEQQDKYESLRIKKAEELPDDEKAEIAQEHAAVLADKYGLTEVQTRVLGRITDRTERTQVAKDMAPPKVDEQALASAKRKMGAAQEQPEDLGSGSGGGQVVRTMDEIAQTDTRRMTLKQLQAHNKELDEAMRASRR